MKRLVLLGILAVGCGDKPQKVSFETCLNMPAALACDQGQCGSLLRIVNQGNQATLEKCSYQAGSMQFSELSKRISPYATIKLQPDGSFFVLNDGVVHSMQYYSSPHSTPVEVSFTDKHYLQDAWKDDQGNFWAVGSNSNKLYQYSKTGRKSFIELSQLAASDPDGLAELKQIYPLEANKILVLAQNIHRKSPTTWHPLSFSQAAVVDTQQRIVLATPTQHLDHALDF